MKGSLLYAQSGGVTAVINASAAGVISEARLQPERIERVLAARNGILGVLRETLVDTAALSGADLARLRATPGGAFGSCRFDLDPAENNPLQYDRLFDVLAAREGSGPQAPEAVRTLGIAIASHPDDGERRRFFSEAALSLPGR